ncbi:GNAT family N-acetyltransferase [Romboutsia sedimentorum]|uniref:GNAT family N-acetyltransferase n=1 Tax=Romboutsia sedimentorum TaxID=1368474 RepID=UPI0024DE0468|nr:GNAT family N-acetyltransferase [Romboutsia sedimentorum]MDK2584817.1 GNAT family N-acetyltransferase [Romboutsia sedimentorum]
MNYNIKKFSELENNELYQILELRCEVFVVEQNCAYNDVDNKDQDAYHLLLEDNKKIVAGLRILKKGISYDQISIGRVVVSKEHRGLGIAKDMMLKAIEFIENDLGEKKIKISAQAYLIEFYKSIGFVEVSKVYLEDDIPHIDMLYKK